MENQEQETTQQVETIEQPTNQAPDLWNIGKPQETPVETTPIVEAPIVEAAVETPAVEAPKAEQVEKIVEKIIEKHPEFKDDDSKAIYEAIMNNDTDAIYNYLSETRKDYNTMSDLDVVRENLKKQNPTWTDKDIQVELKYKFGTMGQPKDLSEIDKDLDPKEYEQAERYNEALEEKELLLSREARDARVALESTKKTIELPKLPKAEEQPKEVPLTQEQVDELNQKWEANVATEMAKLEDFKFKVGDEEITYKITDEDRRSQAQYMNDFNGEKMARDLGWIDENGNENVLKIAQDMLFLKNKEAIIASSATQMKTKATKEIVAEIKNLDLSPQSASPELGRSLGETMWNI